MRNDGDEAKMKRKVPLTREDKKAIALLIVLCAFSLPSSLPGVFMSPHNPPFPTRPCSLIFFPRRQWSRWLRLRLRPAVRYHPRCSRELLACCATWMAVRRPLTRLVLPLTYPYPTTFAPASSAWRWVRAHSVIFPFASLGATCALTTLLRYAAIPPARTPVVFEDRRVLIMQLSIFAQTPLVADRRRTVHSLCRAQAVVDHTHADDLGLIDVLDVLHRPRVPRQRQSSSVQPVDFRPLTADFFFLVVPVGGRS